MAYCTRVLSKDEEFPSIEELAQLLSAEHPDYTLTRESGSEEEWESLLLASVDEIEVALVERHAVSDGSDGSDGQDEIADLLEDLQGCKPESSVEWLEEYLDSVKTVYTFKQLQGAEFEDGGNALHALRSALWERGDAILQADDEGFTNEEGFHIVWQFSDLVTGPWDMSVLQEGTWHHFKMDLGDPDHREAFQQGEVPADLSIIPNSAPRR
jgi:hypothetical protein